MNKKIEDCVKKGFLKRAASIGMLDNEQANDLSMMEGGFPLQGNETMKRQWMADMLHGRNSVDSPTMHGLKKSILPAVGTSALLSALGVALPSVLRTPVDPTLLRKILGVGGATLGAAAGGMYGFNKGKEEGQALHNLKDPRNLQMLAQRMAGESSLV